MKIAWAALQRYDLPLIAPLQVRPGCAIHRRTGLILTLADGHGDFGYGEIAPLPGFSTESMAQAERQAADFLQVLKGQPVTVDPITLLGGPAAWHAVAPSVRTGVSMALCCLQAHAARRPIAQQLSESASESISVNAFIAGEPDDWVEQAHHLRDAGYTAVKVKVGRSERRAEAEALNSLSLMFGPRVVFRLDANRAWDLDTAVAFAQAVEGLPIDYFEEPLADPRELSEFHFATGQPFALDETTTHLLARGFDESQGTELSPVAATLDPATLAQLLRLADAIIVKPMLAGEFARLPQLLAARGDFAGRAVISSSYESPLGLAMLAQLAGALGGHTAAGLDTAHYFARPLLNTLPPNGPRWDLAALAAGLRDFDPRALEDVCRV